MKLTDFMPEILLQKLLNGYILKFVDEDES